MKKVKEAMKLNSVKLNESKTKEGLYISSKSGDEEYKEKGIKYLVTSLCANIQVMSEIVESLCGKSPQEFIEQDLKIRFEDINLENVK